jgi:hypothetical protein
LTAQREQAARLQSTPGDVELHGIHPFQRWNPCSLQCGCVSRPGAADTIRIVVGARGGSR